MALVTVLPRTAPGFSSLAEPSILPVLDHRDAFEQRWPNFMHFAPYWLEADGLTEGVSVRATKSRSTLLEQAGYRVRFGLLVLEVDYHPDVFPDSETWGTYTTRRGHRFFAELDRDIGPDHYEAEVRHYAHVWASTLGMRIDRQCLDWTHIWALPRVLRDGKALESTIVYPRRPITPRPPPTTLREPIRTRLLGADRDQVGRTPDERVALARDWLKTAPKAVSGQHGDDTTYKVAQAVVRGFWLTPETAVPLLEEWNQANEPPWPTQRLEYKAKEASERGRMAMGVLLMGLGGFLSSVKKSTVGYPPCDESNVLDSPKSKGGYPTPEYTPEGGYPPFDRLHSPGYPPLDSANCNRQPGYPPFDLANCNQIEGGVPPSTHTNVPDGIEIEGGVPPLQPGQSPLSRQGVPPLRSTMTALSTMLASIHTPGPDDQRAHVPDLLLSQFVLQELQAAAPITALDNVLYQHRDGAWQRITKTEWATICDQWEGRSPDDTRFKPISLTFSRKNALRQDLCDRLDSGQDDHPEAIFWTPQGAVLVDGTVKPGLPPVGIDPIPHWDPAAECPRFMAFLEQVVPLQINRELIQSFVGLCHLGRGAEAHNVLCFEGPGRNGKSTLLSIISKTFSSIHRTCLPPQIMDVLERRSALRRAKINIVGEISSKSLLDVTDFKQIVTGDYISIRNLRQDAEMFRPHAGHLFATNLAPHAQDESIGFVSKWMIIYFASIIPEEARIEGLDNILWKAEAPGICRWFLEGAQRMQHQSLVIPKEARDEMRLWQEQADPVRQILNELLSNTSEFALTKVLEAVNLKLAALRVPHIGRERMVRYARAYGFVHSRKADKNVWVKRDVLH